MWQTASISYTAGSGHVSKLGFPEHSSDVHLDKVRLSVLTGDRFEVSVLLTVRLPSPQTQSNRDLVALACWEDVITFASRPLASGLIVEVDITVSHVTAQMKVVLQTEQESESVPGSSNHTSQHLFHTPQ